MVCAWEHTVLCKRIKSSEIGWCVFKACSHACDMADFRSKYFPYLATVASVGRSHW